MNRLVASSWPFLQGSSPSSFWGKCKEVMPRIIWYHREAVEPNCLLHKFFVEVSPVPTALCPLLREALLGDTLGTLCFHTKAADSELTEMQALPRKHYRSSDSNLFCKAVCKHLNVLEIPWDPSHHTARKILCQGKKKKKGVRNTHTLGLQTKASIWAYTQTHETTAKTDWWWRWLDIWWNVGAGEICTLKRSWHCTLIADSFCF